MVWQGVALKLNNPVLLPTVTRVLDRLHHPFTDLLGTGSYFHHISISTIRVLIGFFLSTIIAVPMGLLLGRKEKLYDLINPLVEFIRPLSPIVWIPFALILFKTYTVADLLRLEYNRSILADLQLGMIFVIFYGGFFPIFSNTLHGVQATRNLHLESATLLGCSSKQLYHKIILPSAMPSIMTGLQIGLGRTWMVIVAAEMLPGSDAGIGYIIIYAYELAEMDILVMSMILTGVIGALLTTTLKTVSYKLTFWEGKGY